VVIGEAVLTLEPPAGHQGFDGSLDGALGNARLLGDLPMRNIDRAAGPAVGDHIEDGLGHRAEFQA
jgi:hypothetical protein